MMNLKSTCIYAAKVVLPRGGDVEPWKAKVSDFKDYMNANWGGFRELKFISALEV